MEGRAVGVVRVVREARMAGQKVESLAALVVMVEPVAGAVVQAGRTIDPPSLPGEGPGTARSRLHTG